MKSKLVLFVVLMTSVNIFAQKSASTGGNTTPSLKLSSSVDSMQYVLGAHLGKYIVGNGFAISNPTLFKKGMDDAMGGKQLAVESDSIAPLIIYYQKLGAMARGMEQEKALFELVKKSPGLGVLPSGVCYSIMKAGLGKRPQLADSVDIHLKGFFADGKLFEDTYPKNTPYHTSPNDVIPGIKEILQIMPAGSIWRVYIPAALAFADKGVTDLIPPYSPLIYEVELLNVKENSQK